MVEVIDRVASTVQDSERRYALQSFKALALLTSNRIPEAEAIAKEIVGTESTAAAYGHLVLITAAMVRENRLGLLEAIEAASLDPHGREAAVQVLDEPFVRSLRWWLAEQKNEAGGYRLVEALVRMGWTSQDDPTAIEWYRLQALDGRLKRADLASAREMLGAIEHPGPVIRILITRKYDGLFAPDADRAALFKQAIDLESARSGRDLNQNPDDPHVLLRRLQHLSKIGGHEQILTLTQPYVDEWKSVTEAGEPAFWSIDARADALARLGRHDDAVAILKKLVALDFNRHPDLISMAINLGGYLNAAGRHKEALNHATRLAASAGNHASPYGHMWIWETATCALAAQGKLQEAAPWLAKLQAGRTDNLSALKRAFLCLDRIEDAEAVAIEQLAGDDASDALREFQNVREPAVPRSQYDQLIFDRWEAVVARPAVKAAVEKVGRILDLPVESL